MRLAFLVRHFDPQSGGAEKYAYEVVLRLSRTHECHVFCVNHVELQGVTFHQLNRPWRKMRWLGLLQFAIHANQLIQNDHFDAVYSNENVGVGDIQMVHVRPILHDLFHRPFIESLMNGIKTLLSPRLWCYLSLEFLRFKKQLGRYLVAPSEMTAHQLIHDLGYESSMVKTVLPGVHQREVTMNHDDFRAQFGLTPGHWLLLMVAHDLGKKGLFTVLQAMQNLPDDVHLLCTRDRERSSRWESKVKSLGLSERVHWLPKSFDLALAYSNADVLVHPTKADVYGMVLIEAMSRDLPVICTPAPYCGAAWSWMHKEEAWLLQSPEDVSGLIHGVTELRHDERLRSQLTLAGKRLVHQQNWDDVAKSIEDLLIQSHRSQTNP